MPSFTRGDVSLHYTVTGDPDGPPVLLIAPGGLRSAIDFWRGKPWDPMVRLPDYRVIAMDQRNAGASIAPITARDGWHSYTGDQLALLDHLGVHQVHLVGMCIGGPYIMGLIRAAPERVRSAVMLQPIGLEDNRAAFFDLFDQWAASIAADHPEATDEVWAAFRQAMFGGEFLFNASREHVTACQTPILLLMGDDLYHPESISREFASLAPRVTFVQSWKGADRREHTNRLVRDFLALHTRDSLG